MNESKKSLAIVRNPRLTTGQKNLYTLVCKKISENNKLVFEEARNIYLSSVCRNMINGIPHSYQYSYKTKQFELEPMTEEWLNFTVLHWLTSSLGSLILKGYLTVLPAVDLGLLK